MMSRAEFATLCQNVRRDPAPFMASALQITTKQQVGQQPVAPLILNGPQQKVHAPLVAMRANGEPPRVIVLKARQPGISTYASGLNLTTRLTQPYATTMTVAHLDDAAEKLFRREKFMVSRLPLGLRPRFRSERKNEVGFDYLQCTDGRVALSSTGIIGSAGGKELWRSMTLHGVHLSEFAFFHRDKEVLLGISQTVPESPDSYIVIESTANGMGNAFQTEFQRAEEGESGYRAVFIPWYELPDATMTPPPGFALESDEKQLHREYDIPIQALAWRRHILATKCLGNEDLFSQEYPLTVSSAFLVTGRPAFPVGQLRRMHERAAGASVRVGELDMTAEDVRKQFVPRADGRLRIWRWPTEDHDYVIGADPSAGVEGGDFSCAEVLDRTTQEIVATWHGLLTPIEFAHVLMDLGFYYHTAQLAPEITGGHGFSVIEECRARGYPNFYIWQRTDRIKNTMTNYYGWMTTFATRPLLFDAMHFALVHGDLMIWDPETCFEMMGTRYISPEYAEGEEHDDRVMAAMIAWRVHLETPLPSTGMLPRLQYTIGKGGDLVPEPPKGEATGMHKEIWDDTDRVLAQRTRSPLSNMQDVIVLDGEPEEPEPQDPWDLPGGPY